MKAVNYLVACTTRFRVSIKFKSIDRLITIDSYTKTLCGNAIEVLVNNKQARLINLIQRCNDPSNGNQCGVQAIRRVQYTAQTRCTCVNTKLLEMIGWIIAT